MLNAAVTMQCFTKPLQDDAKPTQDHTRLHLNHTLLIAALQYQNVAKLSPCQTLLGIAVTFFIGSSL